MEIEPRNYGLVALAVSLSNRVNNTCSRRKQGIFIRCFNRDQKSSLYRTYITRTWTHLSWCAGSVIACKTPDLLQPLFTTQGLLIFLLHVVRNSDVRAEIHHKLLKWRFERSVNRAQEKSSTSTSRAKKRCCVESRDEMENTQHSLWLLCGYNTTLYASTEVESMERRGLTTGRIFAGRFSCVCCRVKMQGA